MGPSQQPPQRSPPSRQHRHPGDKGLGAETDKERTRSYDMRKERRSSRRRQSQLRRRLKASLHRRPPLESEFNPTSAEEFLERMWTSVRSDLAEGREVLADNRT